MTTSTDPTTGLLPATDIDLLAALAAARLVGCPAPTSHTISWDHSVIVHVHDHDEAAQWIAWWTDCQDVTDWSIRRVRHEEKTHHYRTGRWRGAQITVVHLTHNEVPAGVTA